MVHKRELPHGTGKRDGVRAGAVRSMGLLVVALAGLLPSKGSLAFAAQPAQEQTCQAQNYAAPSSESANHLWPRQGPVVRLTEACWINADAVQSALAGTSKPQLIDVRPRSAQKANPLRGALQLELSDLASKQFLRQEPLVLVGTGLDYGALEKACETLRQQGFSQVQAVRGGAVAWQSIASANSAAPAGNGQVLPIDAAEWIASLGQGIRWTVLSVSDALQQAPQEQWPVPKGQVVRIQADGKERDAKLAVAIARAYQAANKKRQQPASPEAVIIVPDAQMPDLQRLQFEQALNEAVQPAKPGGPTVAAHRLPVYWLQGGWQGYAQQVAQNAAIQQTASHRLQVPCGRF